MTNENPVLSALERLSAGAASEDDQAVVRSALLGGAIATGDRAVAIGGNAKDMIIVTGDNNKIILGPKDAEAVRALLASVMPPRIHQIQSPPRDFIGRESDLNEMLAVIEKHGVTIAALQGLGGIGKTALALKLAEKLAPRYPDAQIYLQLQGVSSQPLSPAEAMGSVIHAYHPAAKVPDTEADLRSLYQSVLHGQRALLFMDNVANAEQVEPLIPPASCMLLLTSRQHFSLPGSFSKKLATLTPEDARQLLLNIEPRIGEAADEIARLCGYLPLALTLAARLLANNVNLKVTDYTRKLDEAQQRVTLIEASLRVSLELLSEDLQQRWRLLAVFPDTFDELAAAAIWKLETHLAVAILGKLISYSLVEWNPEIARYRLHDLVRVFADAHLTKTERNLVQILHATHYQLILATANQLLQKGGELELHAFELFDLERKNFQVGQHWAEMGTNEQAAELCFWYANDGVDILLLRQQPREFIHWQEAALVAARFLKLPRYESSALNNLASAYADFGESRRAIEFSEQAMRISEQTGDRKSLGVAVGNLGNAYWYLGETSRAIEFYEQRLKIAREVNDRNGELNALGNLGNAYKDLGKTMRAVGLYEQASVIARKCGDRRSEALALSSLAGAYADLGQTKEAIELYEQALIIDREINFRRGESNVLRNMGVSYADLRQFKQAMTLFKQALLIAQDSEDRRGEAHALWQMSRTLSKRGDRKEAIEFAQKALEIYQHIQEPRADDVRKQLAEWKSNSKRQRAMDSINRWLYRD